MQTRAYMCNILRRRLRGDVSLRADRHKRLERGIFNLEFGNFMPKLLFLILVRRDVALQHLRNCRRTRKGCSRADGNADELII